MIKIITADDILKRKKRLLEEIGENNFIRIMNEEWLYEYFYIRDGNRREMLSHLLNLLLIYDNVDVKCIVLLNEFSEEEEMNFRDMIEDIIVLRD